MKTITFNAFSFLQKKLKKMNRPFINAEIEISDNETALSLIEKMNLNENDIEGVFINGRIKPKETTLENGDRVAFLPPGTPGPYRVLLGIRSSDRRK